ncbi:LOW QUALITY PROTEIN: hypothetical protein ACHAXR_009195 [Thalassiosira sp. AJA248-18]
MIRAAITPVIRQRRRNVFVASFATSTAACLAAPRFFRSNEHATCSPSAFNGGQVPGSTSLSLPSNFLDDVEQCCSLILPTMEALLRAARLVAAAAVIAADYKAYFLRRKHPDSLFSQVYCWAFLCKNEDDQNHNMHQLEDTIDQLERDLERAQHDYVDPKSSSENKQTLSNGSADDQDAAYQSTSSLSEQTLAKRQHKEAMLEIANQLATAQEELSTIVRDKRNNDGNSTDDIHQRNADRLLQLCRSNGGVYIKVGQHLANLDLLLPEDYTFFTFDDAPVSSYQDVCKVVKEELGSSPDELFSEFSHEPLASASLAQVHVGHCRETNKKLAIKVQHKGLRETSKGDLLAMSTVVNVAEKIFEEKFTLGWICEELTPQLPKELDFTNEGQNSEAASAHLSSTGLDVVVPRVLWDFTSDRVLTMEFEEGFRATDIENIEKAGICKREVATLISSVFNAQIFGHGFVHCDPHEANVLLREHPFKKGKPQIVLVDHGLYKSLDGDFQEEYARLWKGIVMANIPEIKLACEKLGVHKMYPLLSSMLTSRPFDEVVERSVTRSLDASPAGNGDKAVIRGYAQRYITEIIDMLDIVPRQMLLIFKMNDCLRHLDMALGSPANNLVVAGRYASKRVFQSDQQKHQQFGVLSLLQSWLSYVHVLIRINSYELFSFFDYKARLSLSQ